MFNVKKNQGQLKKSTKIHEIDSCQSESLSSEQTTFFEDDESDQFFQPDDGSAYIEVEQAKRENHPEQDISQVNRTLISAYQQKQIQPFQTQFFSISKEYQKAINEKYLIQTQITSFENGCIKLYQKNYKAMGQNITLLQSLTKKDVKSRKILQKRKQMILQQISYHKTVEEAFQIYQCECGKVFLKKTIINMHIKSSSHKISMSINTLRERKIQHKFYVIFYFYRKQMDLGKNADIVHFSARWLFKSFESILLKGKLHYAYIEQRENKDLVKMFTKYVSSTQNTTQRQIQSKQKYFGEVITAVYKKLHEFHKGNQTICHKCLSKQEQIAVFFLGLNQMLTPKDTQGDLLPNKSNKQHLMSQISNILHQIINPRINEADFSTKKLIMYNTFVHQVIKRLKSFFQNFSYIDIEQILSIRTFQ